MPTPPTEPVFIARGLTKTYRMGEVVRVKKFLMLVILKTI